MKENYIYSELRQTWLIEQEEIDLEQIPNMINSEEIIEAFWNRKD